MKDNWSDDDLFPKSRRETEAGINSKGRSLGTPKRIGTSATSAYITCQQRRFRMDPLQLREAMTVANHNPVTPKQG